MEDVGVPYCPLLRLLILVRLKSLARGFEELAVGKALGSPRLGSELVRFYIYKNTVVVSYEYLGILLLCKEEKKMENS